MAFITHEYSTESYEGLLGLTCVKCVGMFHLYQEAETSRHMPFNWQAYNTLESEDDDFLNDVEEDEVYDNHYDGDDEEEEDEEEDEDEEEEEEEDEEDHNEELDLDGLSDDDEAEGSHSEGSLSPWRRAEFIPREGIESITQQLRGVRRRDERSDAEDDSEAENAAEEPPRQRRRTNSVEENRLYEIMPLPNGVIELPDSLRQALNGISVALDLARVFQPFSKEL